MSFLKSCVPTRAHIFTAKRQLMILVAASYLCGCALELAKLPESSFATLGNNTPTTPQDQIGQTSIDSSSWPKSALALPHNFDEKGSATRVLDRYSAHSPEGVKPTVAAIPTFTVDAFNAPLKPLIFALASDAQLQLNLAATLDQTVTINAISQPLERILDSLSQQAGFAWQRQGDVLSIRDGKAYSQSYPVNYLNIHRRTQSSVGLATQVGTINASDTNGNSIENSSQTRIENVSEHNFWDALAIDIKSLIQQGRSSEGADIVSDVSINREAGLLTLHATPEVHANLQRYLVQLHASAARQVLIEATVVEVALSDNYDAGVDWQLLAKGISGISAAQVLVGAPAVAADTVNRLTAPAGLVSMVQQGSQGDLRATLSLLEQFGDVRILSRPRIIALNNQSSVLKVVDNRVYFTLNVQRRQTEEKDEIVTETEIHTVPVGLVMNVTPQINEHGMVMLNVRPTLSRILGFVNDPNPELALANVRNGVPEIQVREMESMLQVQSGEVAIIGGLMQESRSDNNARLPGVGSLPGIGRLFSRQTRERRQTELLIVLRPTVLGATTTVAHQ